MMVMTNTLVSPGIATILPTCRLQMEEMLQSHPTPLTQLKDYSYSQFFGGEYVSDPSSSASVIYDESQDNAEVYAEEFRKTIGKFSNKSNSETFASFRMKSYIWSDPMMKANESDGLSI
jgi:hypothetical protein